jgi:hypothetical protein
MILKKEVPFSLKDINAEWLTMALREGGVLGDEQVTGFTHTIIGEETGFLGEIAILTLEYSSKDLDAPKTMVLKIPTALKNRRLGQLMGAYEKEIRFYRDLKPTLKIRSPMHYYSALNAVDDPRVILERLKNLNRLPLWAVAIITIIITWIVGLTPRRYVLLIEDVSHHRLGDQLAGCSETDVKAALDAMAKLHAQFWGSDELEDMPWIAPVDISSKIMQLMFLQSIGKFTKANKDHLTERQVRLIDWLKANGIELTEKLGSQPRTLLHGDFRLDNLCFDDKRNEVLIFDWQTMLAGSAGMELAYFLSAALPLETTEEKTDEMIEYYRQGLLKLGVEISPARLRWQYEAGMLSMVHKIAPILFQEQLEMGKDRGPEVMQGWIDKIFRKLERVEFERILDEIPA